MQNNKNNTEYTLRLKDIVEEMCEPELNDILFHISDHDTPMPSVDALSKMVENLRSIMFPGFYGESDLKKGTVKFYIGSALDKVYQQLSQQITRGMCFVCSGDVQHDCLVCETNSREIAMKFITSLPKIRRILASDVLAAYEGDPAAKNYGETIFCYPSIKAMTNHRIAHELHLLEVPLIPRIISEMAHSATGIDIHPGANIGEKFFIDHGTGVVIGETCIIGKNVRLYQGVTLGAKSFPLDEDGNPIKGIPRHPIVEDDVVVYSGATVLGRITIGKGSVIGGNLWITHDVPPGTKVYQAGSENNSSK